MASFPSLLFGVATTAVSFGAHRALLRWAERSFPAVASKRRGLVVACAVIAVFPWVTRLVTMKTRTTFADAVFAASLSELMIVLAAIVPLLALMAASDGSRRRRAFAEAARAAVAPSTPPASPPAVGRRSAIETIGGATLLGATSAAFGWGMTIGRHDYEITEVPVRIAGLPKALDGYSIVQISDIHAGLFVGERELREAKEHIARVRPDLVVATGDLVDFDAKEAPLLARALADFAPRDGVFAILGNHDYYADHTAVSSAVRAAGVTLLVNDARVIRGGFALVGVDDAWSQPYGGPGPNLDKAAASLSSDMPRILLAHQPNGFQHFAGKVALQLSGHTHGGQIFPANILMRGAVAGRYERRGSTLYVNRGFGVAGPPSRVGVPPEITKIVLVAA